MSNKKRITQSAKDFQKEIEKLYYDNLGEKSFWFCFVSVLERHNLEGDAAIKMWYSLKLSFRKFLRKQFSKTQKSCSRWR